MLKRPRINLRSERKDEESLSDISDISCPEQPEFQSIKSKKPKKKRHKFTHSQDKKMLDYIMTENRYDEIKGLSLWKDMEKLQITDHSKQSMRCRFLKILMPNLHQYDIPEKWVDKLKHLFPDLLQERADKENEKVDFPCSMLDKWKRQNPRLKSSPQQAANGADKTGGKKSSEMDTDSKEDSSCESTEPFTESPVVRRSGRKRVYKQLLEFASSSESDVEKKKAPVTESPITPRRGKTRLTKRSLKFDSSSESNAEDKQEKDSSTAAGGSGGPCAAISADSSPSKSTEDDPKGDDDDGAQSDLSDYDQYLFGIAEKNISVNENSPRQGSNVSKSDQADTTHRECLPDTERELDNDDSVSVSGDRRSRLRHRRNLKKVKKPLGDNSTPTTTPSPKKGIKTKLLEFVINSQPEEILSENGNEESCSPEKECDELQECETVISDISKSYGLTNREVLTTIFSFNGDIEKSLSYIRLGPVLSQLEPWTKEEDTIINSTDTANIKTIVAKRGDKLLGERLDFLENYVDSVND